jgi:Ras-related protein Rab-1A
MEYFTKKDASPAVDLKKEYDHEFKVLIIGDSSVGKSSILNRYVDNKFDEVFISTIGVDFKIKKLNVDNKDIKLQIWDTAGQERFKAIIRSYFKSSNGILMVYDITTRHSFNHLKDWYETINTYCDTKYLKLMVVGNKIDRHYFRQVMPEEGAEFANAIGASYIEVSAKMYNNNNVNQLFINLSRKMIEAVDQKKKEEKLPDDIRLSLNRAINNNNDCCTIL